MNIKPREAKSRRAGLAGAEHVAFASELQVFLGDAEPVLGLAQGLEPRLRGFAERAFIQEEARRAAGAAADPPAQLMQLSKSEPLSVLDDHDRRLRHVDADLDHRGRDQDGRVSALKALHRRVAARRPAILP